VLSAFCQEKKKEEEEKRVPNSSISEKTIRLLATKKAV
jgi:hypothetical protein